MSTAEKKLTLFKILKGEINTGIAKANETLTVLRKKIHENTVSDSNPDGLLADK